jgi:hypothetical protein
MAGIFEFESAVFVRCGAPVNKHIGIPQNGPVIVESASATVA